MNALAKKLFIKPGKQLLLVNAPANYLELLQPLPEGVNISHDIEGKTDVILLFVKNSTELNHGLDSVSKTLMPDTVFWIIYPKKSSGIKSDLEMIQGWNEPAKYGLRTVAAAAFNDTWTALRFRPKELVKKSDVCNSEIPKNDYYEFVDVHNKIITLPPDLKSAMEQQALSLDFYEKLSYSNQKEYVLWVLTAKQDKTRVDRIQKTLEKLIAQKKNPSEK
ncbi:YdeI/OmpD-associated family protein [Solitalea koreensis]|uniref:Bacteriocin-protection, YdeI or OmpD-Associated n=1 Tax=Solitalea koreensis TaxID=543615 RepID=A0A521DBK7_9SPHI|nr:YdeI/OmpD-associated family protein [Solitalea koreensis]SMO68511.1 Protein of unknown function [Solitalea koreensis]